jgi:tetratricopeptide (TPR) repeat protein
MQFTYVKMCLGFILLCFSPCHLQGESSPEPELKARKTKEEAFPHFRSRWWNHEKRGDWLYERGLLESAIADFEKALELRDGDSWRARTYGVHFEEYFPHRGLGMALLELNEYDEAIEHLRVSIEQAPSEKAKYYLKKALIDKRLDANMDKKLPLIKVTAEARRRGFRSRLHLKGEISDDGYLKSILVDQKEIDFEPLSQKVTLDLPLSDHDGLQNIVIVAKDGSGKVSHFSLPLLVDTQGPQLSFFDLQERGGRLYFKFEAKDPSGLSSFSLGEKTIRAKGEVKARYSMDVPLDANRPLLTILARDRQGNISKNVLPFWEEM